MALSRQARRGAGDWGRTYWYFQWTEISGRLRQAYVGPDSDRVRSLIETHEQGGAKAAIEGLARAAIALGNASVLTRHFSIVDRLSEYGFFRAGGVLVGTHAFLCFGNMLGVRWSGAERTQVVDFAHAAKQLQIALPSNVEIDSHAAIESLQMGLLPIEHSGSGGECAASGPLCAAQADHCRGAARLSNGQGEQGCAAGGSDPHGAFGAGPVAGGRSLGRPFGPGAGLAYAGAAWAGCPGQDRARTWCRGLAIDAAGFAEMKTGRVGGPFRRGLRRSHKSACGDYLSFAALRSSSALSVCSHEKLVAVCCLPAASV